MTNAEMNRRLSDLNENQIVAARRLIREGNSGRAVAREAGITLKQANAVFQQYWDTQSIRVETSKLDDPNYVGSRHHY